MEPAGASRATHLLAFRPDEQGHALRWDGDRFVHDLQLLPGRVDGRLGVAGDAHEAIGTDVDLGNACGHAHASQRCGDRG
jgi:hypothetical protein